MHCNDYGRPDGADRAAGRRRARLRRGRARRAVALAALAATAATTALALPTGAGSAPYADTASRQEQGMHAGLPFADPPSLRPGADGVLRLTARPTRFDLSGRRVWGESYNGSYVGPTLRLAPGQHVRIVLSNQLPEATNLHFHGLQVSPSGASDNPFLTVGPGRSFTYRLFLPADHPQGTFWYHDHQMAMTPDGSSMPGMAAEGTKRRMSAMGSDGISSTGAAQSNGQRTPHGASSDSGTPTGPGLSTSDLENQMMAGLAGTLLVGDDRSLLPARLRHIREHILALKDVQIAAGGHIVQNTATTAIDSNAPTVRLVNGLLRPVLTLRPGETQLWRLANEGADIFYTLRLDGTQFTVIGEDGDPEASVHTASTLLLPPGKRYDVLITAPSRPGAAWLRTLPYSNGPQGDSYPQAKLMEIRAAGRTVPRLAMPTGGLPTAPTSLAHVHVAQKRNVILSEDSTGKILFINSKQFSMTHSIFTTPGVVNTVEQWTISNTSGETHPFHIHTYHFQVMSINGVPQPYDGLQDTVPIPHERHGVPGRVVIRIRLARFTGKWMFHCHIAAHEDNGMMSYLNVVARTPSRPYRPVGDAAVRRAVEHSAVRRPVALRLQWAGAPASYLCHLLMRRLLA